MRSFATRSRKNQLTSTSDSNHITGKFHHPQSANMMPLSFGKAQCLVHFLESLDSLPIPSITTKPPSRRIAKPKAPKIFTTHTEEIASKAATRQQPSRRAKKHTDFYELENPHSLKRKRGDELRDITNILNSRPRRHRREALEDSNYDVNLDDVEEHKRAEEILWAAKRIIKTKATTACCFSNHPIACYTCELSHVKVLPKDSPLSPPRNKRIRLVGRLAPVARMAPSKVSLVEAPRWDSKKGVRPFMIVRFRDQEFAVDFCKELVFVPMKFPAADFRTRAKLFGSKKK